MIYLPIVLALANNPAGVSEQHVPLHDLVRECTSLYQEAVLKDDPKFMQEAAACMQDAAMVSRFANSVESYALILSHLDIDLSETCLAAQTSRMVNITRDILMRRAPTLRIKPESLPTSEPINFDERRKDLTQAVYQAERDFYRITAEIERQYPRIRHVQEYQDALKRVPPLTSKALRVIHEAECKL